MTNTGLESLVDNLKHLIYSDNNPLIYGNPFLQDKMSHMEFLYQEFQSLRTFLIDMEVPKQPAKLEKVRNLKKSLRDVVDEAEDVLDLFLTSSFIRNNNSMTMSCDAENINRSPNFNHLMQEIKSIKKEIMDTKMKPPSVTSPTRNISRAALKEEIIVGLEDDSMVLLDRLTRNQKQLDVISIVGMGGLGKTTLATKVFNDPFIVYHFHVRAWVTVSQAYDNKDLLISILTSIGKIAPEEIDKLKDHKISELLYKSLKDRRYLIVIDDVWSTKAWDYLKLHFPNDNTESRILLTTRISEIAFYAKPAGFSFTHHLQFLTEEESWELLCKKVFQEDDCPEILIKPGMKIVKDYL